MRRTYGGKKGESVFYATVNKRKGGFGKGPAQAST